MHSILIQNSIDSPSTPISEYYNTQFENNDVQSAYNIQSHISSKSYNKTRLSNLTIPLEHAPLLGKIDMEINASTFTLNGITRPFDLNTIISNIRPRSNIMINIPDDTNFLNFWLNLLVNTNVIIWTALPKNSYNDVFNNYNINILQTITTSTMNNFSRSFSVAYDIINLQFNPTIDILHALTLKHFSFITSQHYTIHFISMFMTNLAQLRSGALAFNFITNTFAINSLIVPKHKIISYLSRIMLEADVQLDSSIASISGIFNLFQDVSFEEIHGRSLSFLTELFSHADSLKTNYSTTDLSKFDRNDFCLLVFRSTLACFKDELYLTTLSKYLIMDRNLFGLTLIAEYRSELKQSLDIASSISTDSWKSSYAGEGFVSLLIALYYSRYLNDAFVPIYSNIIETIFHKHNVLYCSSDAEYTYLTSQHDNKDVLSPLDLYIEHDHGLLSTLICDDFRITLTPYLYTHDPNHSSNINNVSLDYIVNHKLGRIIRADVSLCPKAEFCNRSLNANLSISTVSSIFEYKHLEDMNRLATYYCYFPDRIFDREVMYYDRKTDLLSNYSYVVNFKSKFTSVHTYHSSSPTRLIFHSKHLGSLEFISWYVNGDMFEFTGSQLYQYSITYPKLPLKIEEYVQHKYLGYVSPIIELNESCYKLMVYIKNALTKDHITDSLYSEFSNSASLENPPVPQVKTDSVALIKLQSLYHRHKLTSIINDAYFGTGHVLIVRPLVLMAQQTDASETLTTASGDKFNVHHSLLTNPFGVEYVCRVCGNIGTSQYITRICEFVNSMDASVLDANFRFYSCYDSTYLEYESYTSQKKSSIKALRSLRTPTSIKNHGIVLTNSFFVTESFGVCSESPSSQRIELPYLSGLHVTDSTCFANDDFFSRWARPLQSTISSAYPSGPVFTSNSISTVRRARLIRMDDENPLE